MSFATHPQPTRNLNRHPGPGDFTTGAPSSGQQLPGLHPPPSAPIIVSALPARVLRGGAGGVGSGLLRAVCIGTGQESPAAFWERPRIRLAKTRRRQAGIRRNWRHDVSREIADNAHTVIVEDLRVHNMTRSARGTAEEPGTKVRARSPGSTGSSSTPAGQACARCWPTRRDASLQSRRTTPAGPAMPAAMPRPPRGAPRLSSIAWPAAMPTMRTRMPPATYGAGAWRNGTGRLPGGRAGEP